MTGKRRRLHDIVFKINWERTVCKSAGLQVCRSASLQVCSLRLSHTAVCRGTIKLKSAYRKLLHVALGFSAFLNCSNNFAQLERNVSYLSICRWFLNVYVAHNKKDSLVRC